MVDSTHLNHRLEPKLLELLNNPAVQSGIAPFLVAAVVAVLLRNTGWSGLSVIAGFAVAVYLASDFNITPLTSSRKIVLAGILAAATGVILDVLRSTRINSAMPVFGGIAVLWAAQRILQNQDVVHMMLWGTGCATYVAALVWGMDRALRQSPPHTSSAAAALGFGTGAAALFGASALLGQFALALGSAAFAHLLVQMLTNKALAPGRVVTLPVSIVAGSAACVTVLSAKLPWYALLVLAVIPAAASFVPLTGRSVRTKGFAMTLLTFAISGVAVFLAWRSAGDIPL